ncbi:MAG: 50S ribosomal protein L18 [Candidatus Aenigmarchaeota archaeon]|nr:50S ribosomal protein L18 [Candidatus Aenigmarchaeota archaeon]MDI6722956.1 50S ribosomal protein L18 [Candidatus Aenigmarchaeota archaeon]
MRFRRRREKTTDYNQRLALIKSGKPRIVIRRSLKDIRIQIISFSEGGDVTAAEKTSKTLAKYGWNYHCGNTPAAYLTGYLAGAEALSKGIKEAVVDIGIQDSVKGSVLYAAALGAKDAGIKINLGKEVLPSRERISGKHIAEYAALIRNTHKYQKQFSSYLKNGTEPERIVDTFEHVKKEITQEFSPAKEAF